MTKHRTGTRKDGIVVHLEHHDVAFATVSRAPLAKLQTYKRRMGWRFPWASSLGSDFNLDFNISFSEEQQREGGIEYNYGREAGWEVAGIGDSLKNAATDLSPKSRP
jgi:predicted dithiol-disulfide oxidoreductase (DUF899 family)